MSLPKKEITVILDPFASTAYLFDRLKDCGIKVIVVYSLLGSISSNKMIQAMIESIHKSDPEKKFILSEITLTGSFKKDIEYLKSVLLNYKVQNYIYGFEGNLGYLEQLTYALDPDLSNNPETSHVRSIKSDMQEALSVAGLPAIKQIRITDTHNLEAQANVALSEWGSPVIVKPNVGGGASTAIFLCKKKSEIINSVKSSLNTPGALSVPISEMLIQEFIDGDEYFVDMASYKGKHMVSGVFKYKKILIDNLLIYRSIQFVDPGSAADLEMREYSKKIVKALYVHAGFSHIEIKDSSKGLRLIEYNGRISGASGLPNYLAKKLTAKDQVSALYDDILGYQCQSQQVTYRHGEIIFMYNFGHLYQGIDLHAITSLSSYSKHIILNKSCHSLKKTTSLFDYVMYIVLLSNNTEAMQNDIDKLRTIEKTGEYFI